MKYLIPKFGIRVPDPRSKAPLLVQGEYKEWSGPNGRYWRRRYKDGDVTIGKPPKSIIVEENIEVKKSRKKGA